MSDSRDLPASLLARLEHDSLESTSLIASGDLPSAVSQTREYAHRRLLSLTPRALDTVESVMLTGLPKEQILAAREVLSRSPATRDELALSMDRALPAAFSSALATLLSSFARSLTPASPDTRVLTPAETSVTSDPLTLPSLPPPTPDVQMTSKGLTQKKRRGRPPKKSPDASEPSA